MRNCESLKSQKGKRRRVLNYGDPCKGLKQHQLKKNKNGAVVSLKKHKQGKARYHQLDIDGPKGWNHACKEARKILGYWLQSHLSRSLMRMYILL